MLKLRPYQLEAIEAIKRDWQSHTDVLLTCATGGGKTAIFLALLNQVIGAKRALIIAHRQELIYQPRDRMLDYYPEWKDRVGVVMADENDNDKQITIATVQTLQSEKRLEQLLSNGIMDYLISDEAHHNCAKTRINVVEALKNVNPELRHLGVTATPIRADGDGLSKVYQKESAHYGIVELIKLGYLAPVRWLAIQVGISLAGVKVQAGDFQKKQLSDVFETSNCFDLVVESHKKYARDRQAIAFTVSVEGAHSLAETFRDAGITAEAADGTTDKKLRQKIMDDFRAGKTQVLVNCLDEKTEILTRRGWVGIDDIKENDVSAAVSPETGKVYWEPLSRIVKRPRGKDEPMVHINNQTFNSRVTGEHRMLVRTRAPGAWEFHKASTLPDRISPYRLMVSASAEPENIHAPQVPEKYTKIGRAPGLRYMLKRQGLIGEEAERRIVESAERKRSMHYKNPNELTLDECRFIGLFISDGHMSNGGRGIEISQSFRYKKNNQEITRILESCGFDYSRTTKNSLSNITGRKHESFIYRIPMGLYGGELERKGYFELVPYLDKDMNDLFMGFDRSQTLALIQGWWLGDGCKDDRKSTGKTVFRIVGTNLVAFERLQILCVLRQIQASISEGRHNGVMATKLIYSIGIHDRTSITTNNCSVPTSGGNPAKIETDWCAERVWCVTNQTGTIITRRGGRIMIMGQCALFTEGLDIPEVSCIHQVRPTRSDGLYTQIIGRSLRTFPGKVDALILDYAPIEDRNIAMVGDVLGIPLRRDVYIKPSEEKGEVMGGFTFDGSWNYMEGSPEQIISRQLDYLEMSPWSWYRSDGWMTLGMGKASDNIERTLALSPPEDGIMKLYGIIKKDGYTKHYNLGEGAFEVVKEKADDLANKWGNAVLARKKKDWRKKPASEKQINFAKRLKGAYKVGISMGEQADRITHALAVREVGG